MPRRGALSANNTNPRLRPSTKPVQGAAASIKTQAPAPSSQHALFPPPPRSGGLLALQWCSSRGSLLRSGPLFPNTRHRPVQARGECPKCKGLASSWHAATRRKEYYTSSLRLQRSSRLKRPTRIFLPPRCAASWPSVPSSTVPDPAAGKRRVIDYGRKTKTSSVMTTRPENSMWSRSVMSD